MIHLFFSRCYCEHLCCHLCQADMCTHSRALSEPWFGHMGPVLIQLSVVLCSPACVSPHTHSYDFIHSKGFASFTAAVLYEMFWFKLLRLAFPQKGGKSSQCDCVSRFMSPQHQWCKQHKHEELTTAHCGAVIKGIFAYCALIKS